MSSDEDIKSIEAKDVSINFPLHINYTKFSSKTKEHLQPKMVEEQKFKLISKTDLEDSISKMAKKRTSPLKRNFDEIPDEEVPQL